MQYCLKRIYLQEFHSVTLTSAPHEDFLQINIKAVGPWTWKLRNFFDKTINDKEEEKDNPPKIRIEGPYGGGNQDWYKFEVAVMVSFSDQSFILFDLFTQSEASILTIDQSEVFIPINIPIRGLHSN